jgi:hypothetical protein
VRHDQTDPGIDTNTRNEASNREVPVRSDGDNGGSLRRRERAGSPSAMVSEGASSWQDIKSRFVDDPAGAISAAEELVRLAMERRIRALQEEVSAMCAQGRDEESSSTEGLRTRLIRYQEYCERLGGSALH